MDPNTPQPRPVSPYSLRGIGNAVASGYGSAVGAVSNLIERAAAPFSRPPGYTPAVVAPAPAPVAVAAPVAAPAPPAPTIGGAIDAIRQREQMLQNLANGGEVQRVDMRHGGEIPGTSPSPGADNIPVNATAKEYMLPVDTVQAVGKDKLDALVAATHKPIRGPGAAMGRGKAGKTAMMRNGGCVKRMANGGLVDDPRYPKAGGRSQQGPSVSTTAPTTDPQAGMAAFVPPHMGRKPPSAIAQVDSKPSPSASSVRAVLTGATEDVRGAAGRGDVAGAIGSAVRGAAALPIAYLADTTINPLMDAARAVQPVASRFLSGLTGDVQGQPTAASAPAAAAPQAAAAAPAAAATAPRRFVDAQGNAVQPPATTATAAPAAAGNVLPGNPGLDSATDAALAAARAGAVARGESLGPSAAANLPAGYGASVMPDHQAERNAQFDREVMLDRAARLGGRAEGRILNFLSEQDRIAAGREQAGQREAGADRRLQVSEEGATARNRESIAASDRREGPGNAVRTASATLDLKAKQKVQAAQDAYDRAVAGGDAAAIKKAEATLRAAQGKWDAANNFSAVAVPGGVDPATGLPTGSSVVVYNRETGEVRPGLSASQARGGQRPVPAAGTVQGGYRFKGGNPADPKSWEKV